jgi:FKBP-type peptidyl-prolyl cis-trans isomerase
VLFLIISCDSIERKSPIDKKINSKKKSDTSQEHSKDSSDSLLVLDSTTNIGDKEIDSVEVTIVDIQDEFEYVDQFEMSNGLKIFWSRRSRSRKLEIGDVVQVDYRLTLTNGAIIDGTNKLNRATIPFIIGYNMQMKGWDLALNQMAVGDIAKVEIPASLAYGKKGLGSLIPPNSTIWLFIQIHGLMAPIENRNGIKVWEVQKGSYSGNSNNKVVFDMIVSTPSKANAINTFNKSPISYPEDMEFIPTGLSKVLKKAKDGGQLFVTLNSEMAYGSKGYKDLIRPNENVFYNLKILKTE